MGNESSKAGAKKGSLDQHLRTAAKTGVVNLSNRKMEKIPKDLLSFSNLRTLDISNNKLISIDPLKVLGNLTKINASGNNLVRVDLGTFHKLKTAELANNQISAIIRLPEKITTLDISSNELISIPDAVTTNSSLTSIDISRNKLTKLNSKLPESLVELNLNDNQLNSLQGNYLSADLAPALKILRLNNNCLKRG